MEDKGNDPGLESKISRRRLLAALGAIGAGAALAPLAAACSGAAPASTPTAAPKPAEGAATAAPTKAAAPATPTAAAAGGQKVVIKLGHHHLANGQVDNFAKKFGEILAQKTNGQAEVQIFPGAQLGQEGEAVEGIHLGSLQMTIGSSPFLDKYVREMGVEQLPFLFDDWDHAMRCLKGPVGEELTKRLLERSNVKALGWMSIGWRHMLFREKQVDSLEGMKGLKMRAPQSWIYVKMFESLGSKPTTITWGEAYTALQTGVVDGMETPLQSGIDMKFAEVAKHWLLTSHMFSSITHMVNKNFFNGLPANVQKAIVEASKEAIDWNDKKTIEDEKTAVDVLKSKYGNTFRDPKDREAFRKAVQPMYQEFAKDRPGATSIIDLINAQRKK